jgi:hypothetical protein
MTIAATVNVADRLRKESDTSGMVPSDGRSGRLSSLAEFENPGMVKNATVAKTFQAHGRRRQATSQIFASHAQIEGTLTDDPR